MKNLENLYNESEKLLRVILNNNMPQKEMVKHFRKILGKEVLNKYCILCKLPFECKTKLNSKVLSVKFSMDNMLKNRINHSELNFNDYAKINKIIMKPDKIALSKNNDTSILLFKKDGEYYLAAIKTTEDKEENFLISFRRSGKKEFNKY